MEMSINVQSKFTQNFETVILRVMRTLPPLIAILTITAITAITVMAQSDLLPTFPLKAIPTMPRIKALQ